jgi:hypothetical protein
MEITQLFQSGEVSIVADPAASPQYSATFSSQQRKSLVRPREPEASCRWAVPAPPSASCRWAVPAPPSSPQSSLNFLALKMPTRSVDNTQSVDKKSSSATSSPTMALKEMWSPPCMPRRSPDRGPRLPRRELDQSPRDTVSILTEALEMADMCN